MKPPCKVKVRKTWSKPTAATACNSSYMHARHQVRKEPVGRRHPHSPVVTPCLASGCQPFSEEVLSPHRSPFPIALLSSAPLGTAAVSAAGSKVGAVLVTAGSSRGSFGLLLLELLKGSFDRLPAALPRVALQVPGPCFSSLAGTGWYRVHRDSLRLRPR